MVRFGDGQSDLGRTSSTTRPARGYNPCCNPEAFHYAENHVKRVNADPDFSGGELVLHMQSEGGTGGGGDGYGAMQAFIQESIKKQREELKAKESEGATYVPMAPQKDKGSKYGYFFNYSDKAGQIALQNFYEEWSKARQEGSKEIPQEKLEHLAAALPRTRDAMMYANHMLDTLEREGLEVPGRIEPPRGY